MAAVLGEFTRPRTSLLAELYLFQRLARSVEEFVGLRRVLRLECHEGIHKGHESVAHGVVDAAVQAEAKGIVQVISFQPIIGFLATY